MHVGKFVMLTKQTAVRSGDSVFSIDTIEHEGSYWIVLSWTEYPAIAKRTPGQALRLPKHAFQRPENMVFDLVLNTELPKAALDGQSIPPYEHAALPHLFFDMPQKASLN